MHRRGSIYGFVLRLSWGHDLLVQLRRANCSVEGPDLDSVPACALTSCSSSQASHLQLCLGMCPARVFVVVTFAACRVWHGGIAETAPDPRS